MLYSELQIFVRHDWHRFVTATGHACIKISLIAATADNFHALDKHFSLYHKGKTAAVTKLGSAVTCCLLQHRVSCCYVHEYIHLLLQKDKA